MAEQRMQVAERSAEQPEAVKTDPKDANLGAGGITLPNPEIAGVAVRDAKPADAEGGPEDPLAKAARLRREAFKSREFAELAARSNRGQREIGLWEEGDQYNGTGILVNVKTLEKVRFTDQKINEPGIWANSRDLAVELVTGEVRDNL